MFLANNNNRSHKLQQKPKLTVDKLPDVNQVHTATTAIRQVIIEKQITKLKEEVTQNTMMAIGEGAFTALLKTHHHEIYPETLKEITQWLGEKGYQIERVYLGCSCSAHFKWSWEVPRVQVSGEVAQ